MGSAKKVVWITLALLLCSSLLFSFRVLAEDDPATTVTPTATTPAPDEDVLPGPFGLGLGQWIGGGWCRETLIQVLLSIEPLGLDEAELRAALASGTSVAELLAGTDVSIDEIVDAFMQTHEPLLERLQAQNRLSEEQVEQLRLRIEETVRRRLEEGSLPLSARWQLGLALGHVKRAAGTPQPSTTPSDDETTTVALAAGTHGNAGGCSQGDCNQDQDRTQDRKQDKTQDCDTCDQDQDQDRAQDRDRISNPGHGAETAPGQSGKR